MGLAASQARFLQLTARKSDVEYQAQRITFERLALSDKTSEISNEYQNKTSNRVLTFSYNDGQGKQSVDVTYNNYKNYMNQQQAGLTSSQEKLFLISSSGNKIVVSNEDEMNKIIESNTKLTTDEDGKTAISYIFSEADFMFADDLDDTSCFQESIRDGVYYFGTLNDDYGENESKFSIQDWSSVGAGAISDIYDTTDDASAQAKYDTEIAKIQKQDKLLELELDQLNSERDAIQTEMESVKKVIEDNIDKSFDAFS